MTVNDDNDAPSDLNDVEEQPSIHSFATNALTAAAEEAGQFSPAVALVEIWLWDEERNLLVLQRQGCWTCPSLGEQVGSVHKPDDTVSPGVDVVGNLWTQTNQKQASKKLQWISVKGLLQDPDTAKGDRLSELKELGLEVAAGVPFKVDGQAGMVVYMGKCPKKFPDHAKVLANSAHDKYLHRTATLMGNTLALTRAKNRLLETSSHVKESLQHSLHDHQCFSACNCCPVICDKLSTVARKARGAGMKVPPPMTNEQAIWTWFGTFITLLVLSGIDFGLEEGTDAALLIGPFGALMTLQYGLTSAPASQPRNAILGQIVSGAIALAFTAIPGLPVWFQQAFGPAFSVAAMCRLGIPHPPAGAHAVLYASGSNKVELYGIVVMCTVVSCICATIINNLSEKRQYPTYWGPLFDKLAEKTQR